MTNRFIARLNLFADLDARDLRALERATGDVRPMGPRQDLIRERDRPGPTFVLLDGWAARYKILPDGSRQIMTFLMPGDACDLHPALPTPVDHGIQTLTHAHVATIARAAMDGLMQDHPRVARALYVAHLADEGMLRAWIVSLGRRSSIERVAHLLLELHVKASRFAAADDASEMPLSQVVLADALGVTPVHINRMLQELRRMGAVELRRGALRLVEPAALVRIAGFDETYLERRLEEGAAAA